MDGEALLQQRLLLKRPAAAVCSLRQPARLHLDLLAAKHESEQIQLHRRSPICSELAGIYSRIRTKMEEKRFLTFCPAPLRASAYFTRETPDGEAEQNTGVDRLT